MADEAQRVTVQGALESALGKQFQVGTRFSGTELFASIQLTQASFNLFGVLAFFYGRFYHF
jgi:hypothetical protein